MARKRPRGSASPLADASRLVLDRPYLAEDLFLSRLPSLPINSPVVRSPLSEVEDNRYWRPDPLPGARSLRRWTVRTKLNPRRKTIGRSSNRLLRDIQNLTFSAPKFVIRCVRRKVRDQVLHALGKTGKGSGRKLRNRKYKRNSYSGVHC